MKAKKKYLEQRKSKLYLSAQEPLICLAALEYHLSEFSAEWDERVCLGVVMAAAGYPEPYAKGYVISRLPVKEQEALSGKG